MFCTLMFCPQWGKKIKKKKRFRFFEGFTIDSKLVVKLKEDLIILHCLPAYRSRDH